MKIITKSYEKETVKGLTSTRLFQKYLKLVFYFMGVKNYFIVRYCLASSPISVLSLLASDRLFSPLRPKETQRSHIQNHTVKDFFIAQFMICGPTYAIK